MTSTMELLNMTKAPQYADVSAAEWCKQLGVNRTALHVAKARGRLSPTIAGNLARLMGEDETTWIAIAAMEAEPDTYGKAKIMQNLLQKANWRKR